MGIVHLDHPQVVVHKTNRHSKWDVTTAEWSPHETEYFALAVSIFYNFYYNRLWI